MEIINGIIIQTMICILVFALGFSLGYNFCMHRFRVNDLMKCIKLLTGLINETISREEAQKILDELEMKC